MARTWNFNVVGNLFQQKDALHTNLQVLQQAYVQSKDPNLLASEHDLTLKLHLAEEIFWCQRARTNWLARGDKNTFFFQTQALIRKKRKQILKLKDYNEQDISYTVNTSFKKRFSSSLSLSRVDLNSFISSINPCITVADNDLLTAAVTIEEVHKALFYIGLLKAPGPDGIYANFYHTYWPHLKESLYSMVLELF